MSVWEWLNNWPSIQSVIKFPFKTTEQSTNSVMVAWDNGCCEI